LKKVQNGVVATWVTTDTGLFETVHFLEEKQVVERKWWVDGE
jgi:hypothetical protein